MLVILITMLPSRARNLAALNVTNTDSGVLVSHGKEVAKLSLASDPTEVFVLNIGMCYMYLPSQKG